MCEWAYIPLYETAKELNHFLSEMYTVAVQKLYSSVISMVSVLKSARSTRDSQIGIMCNCFSRPLHRDPEGSDHCSKAQRQPGA